jgi:hypothetical protein
LRVPVAVRWFLAAAIAVLVTAVPVVRYRCVYRHEKRLREVTPDRFYRCGWLSAPGFTEAIKQHGIRCVINVMEDEPNPALFKSYFFGGEISERDLCKQLNVRYVWLPPDLLDGNAPQGARPDAVDKFLRVLDDKDNYPVLLHCKAGLHRTGVLTAVYRMEYDGWTPLHAWQELKANGFGEFNCFADNPYIEQYVLSYRPGLRRGSDGRVAAARPAR